MPSLLGLRCDIYTDAQYHVQAKKEEDIRETAQVPELDRIPKLSRSTVTSVIAPKPYWFEIHLEVLQYLSEYLAVLVHSVTGILIYQKLIHC